MSCQSEPVVAPFDAAQGVWPLCLNQERALLAAALARRGGYPIRSSPSRLCLRLTGPLDIDALEKALNGVLDRHASLRIAIFENPDLTPEDRSFRLAQFAQTSLLIPGTYLQSTTVCPGLSLKIAGMQASAHDDRILTRALEDDASSSFTSPPRMRASLVNAGPDDHLLLLTLDHLVSDGFSTRIIRNELGWLYEHFASGGMMPKPPVLSFLDFCAWQSQAIHTSYFDRDIEHWRRQWKLFADAQIDFHDLPFSLPRAERPGMEFGTAQLECDSGITGAIKAFGRQMNCTIHATFMAACAILLRIYTGRTRIGIWGNFSNRCLPGFDEVPGYFSNAHLLGFDFEADSRLMDFLYQVRTVLFDAMDHQELPLPRLWQTLGYCPRFADLFVLLDSRQGSALSGRRVAGLAIAELPLPETAAPRRSKCGVYVTDWGDTIRLRMKYAVDRFPREAIVSLLTDLHSILAAMVANPAAHVSSLLRIGSHVAPASIFRKRHTLSN